MIVKDLIEKLQKFPEDKEVLMWGIKYFENGELAGMFPVTEVCEIKTALNRSYIGKVKVDFEKTE